MIRTQNNYRKIKSEPQSLESVTIPNQAPQLRLIIASIASGDIPRVQMSGQYDNSPTLDDVDLSRLDMRHMSAQDFERYFPKPVEVVPEPTPVDS